MPRVTKKKKPLRGSVRQNNAAPPEEERPPFLSFGAKLALLVVVSLATIVFAAWLWRSNWPHRQAARLAQATLGLTQKTGFAIDDVVVEGRRYTEKDSLLAALNVRAGGPILAFDPQASYDKIMALPWTEQATVLRSLPSKIVVRLTERQPMARWQHDDKTVVIDKSGRELEAAKPESFPGLPLVVGNAAPEQTKALLDQLRAFPIVAQNLKAAVRVGERRWNFHLQPRLVVRLPERDEEAALTKLTQLIQEQKITDRNVAVIDLRIPDRMIIEPVGAQTPSPADGAPRE